GFLRLCRICVNNLIPDKVLLCIGRQMLDVLVNKHEFRQRGDVEAGSSSIEGPHNGGLSINLDCKVNLNFKARFLKGGVILPQDFVVDYYQGSAMLTRQSLQLPGCHVDQDGTVAELSLVSLASRFLSLRSQYHVIQTLISYRISKGIAIKTCVIT